MAYIPHASGAQNGGVQVGPPSNSKRFIKARSCEAIATQLGSTCSGHWLGVSAKPRTLPHTMWGVSLKPSSFAITIAIQLHEISERAGRQPDG